MKIDGTKLLIYADDQPIGCTTSVEIGTSKEVWEPVTSLTEGQKEWTFTCEGAHKFDDFEHTDEELNKLLNQAINNLPRKLKKRFKRALFNGKFLNVSMGLKKHQHANPKKKNRKERKA